MGLLTLVEIFTHAKRTPVKPGVTGASCPTRSGISQADCVDYYLAHTAYINNWDLVDLSCYPLLGVWLLDKDRSLLYDLACKGKTLWEQRIGIVSTMTFIRHGQLDDTFAIADDTRAVIGDSNVEWIAGDQVGMFVGDYKGYAKVDVTTSPKMVVLYSTTAIPAGTMAYAYAPYDEDNKTSEATPEWVKITLSDVQSGAQVSAMPAGSRTVFRMHS